MSTVLSDRPLTPNRISCLEEREDLRDRLDFVRGQISRLSNSTKDRIRALSNDVTTKVNTAATLQQHQPSDVSRLFRTPVTVFHDSVSVGGGGAVGSDPLTSCSGGGVQSRLQADSRNSGALQDGESLRGRACSLA